MATIDENCMYETVLTAKDGESTRSSKQVGQAAENPDGFNRVRLQQHDHITIERGNMSNSPMSAVKSHEEILTAAEIAVELRCCKAEVHKFLNGRVKGVPKLPALKIGRKRVVIRSTFEAWKRQNESGAIDTFQADAMLAAN